MIWELKDVSVVLANPELSHSGPERSTGDPPLLQQQKKKEKELSLMLHGLDKKGNVFVPGKTS